MGKTRILRLILLAFAAFMVATGASAGEDGGSGDEVPPLNCEAVSKLGWDHETMQAMSIGLHKGVTVGLSFGGALHKDDGTLEAINRGVQGISPLLFWVWTQEQCVKSPDLGLFGAAFGALTAHIKELVTIGLGAQNSESGALSSPNK